MTQLVMTNEESYTCEYCQVKFETIGAWRRHEGRNPRNGERLAGGAGAGEGRMRQLLLALRRGREDIKHTGQTPTRGEQVQNKTRALGNQTEVPETPIETGRTGKIISWGHECRFISTGV